MKIRWAIVFFTCLILHGAAVAAISQWPQDVPEAIKALDALANRLKSLDDILDAMDGFFQEVIPPGAPYQASSDQKGLLENPHPVVVDSFPDLSDEAIYDFRQSLKNDFIKVTGSAEGTLSQTQFDRMVQVGLFPLKNDSPENYFTRHDKDRDRRLTLNEFVPTPAEVAREQKMEPLTKAYTEGKPYPTGQAPTTKPPSKPGADPAAAPPPNRPPPDHPIFATPEQIEERIRDFAAAKGLATERDPTGKLYVVAPDGSMVQLPPGVIPIPLPVAEEGLKEVARNIGGTTKRNDEGILLVVNGAGEVVPVEMWPKGLQPPYLPPAPDGPPPPPPPPK